MFQNTLPAQHPFPAIISWGKFPRQFLTLTERRSPNPAQGGGEQLEPGHGRVRKPMPGRGTGARAEIYTLAWILCQIYVWCVYYGFTKKVLCHRLFHLIKTKVGKDAPYFVLPPFKLFSAFHSLWKGKSVSLPNLRNKDLAAMLLENFGIQIKCNLAWIYSKLAPALKTLTAPTRSSNYLSCLLNLSEKNAPPWKPKVNALMCVLSCWSQ